MAGKDAVHPPCTEDRVPTDHPEQQGPNEVAGSSAGVSGPGHGRLGYAAERSAEHSTEKTEMKRWIVVCHEPYIVPHVWIWAWKWIVVGEPMATRQEAEQVARERLSPKMYIAEIKMNVTLTFIPLET